MIAIFEMGKRLRWHLLAVGMSLTLLFCTAFSMADVGLKIVVLFILVMVLLVTVWFFFDKWRELSTPCRAPTLVMGALLFSTAIAGIAIALLLHWWING